MDNRSSNDLTETQKKLQIKFLACHKHNKGCHCYLPNNQPVLKLCSRAKKLSRSWVKNHTPNGPIVTGNICEMYVKNCCPDN